MYTLLGLAIALLVCTALVSFVTYLPCMLALLEPTRACCHALALAVRLYRPHTALGPCTHCQSARCITTRIAAVNPEVKHRARSETAEVKQPKHRAPAPLVPRDKGERCIQGLSLEKGRLHLQALPPPWARVAAATAPKRCCTPPAAQRACLLAQRRRRPPRTQASETPEQGDRITVPPPANPDCQHQEARWPGTVRRAQSEADQRGVATQRPIHHQIQAASILRLNPPLLWHYPVFGPRFPCHAGPSLFHHPGASYQQAGARATHEATTPAWGQRQRQPQATACTTAARMVWPRSESRGGSKAARSQTQRVATSGRP